MKKKSFMIATGIACNYFAHAGAQDFPNKPVRIIASSPRTTSDLLARFVGNRLSERWGGRSVIVENRTGAPSAMMPAIKVAGAEPNGNTLLMGETASLATAPSEFKKLDYNPVQDFAPITLVARTSFVLVASAKLPVSDLGQFIAYAKERPTQLNYASATTIGHLATEMFLQLTGIKAVHVPYRGAGAATLAVAAGEVQFASLAVSSAMELIRPPEPRLRALAVASKKRVEQIKDVPTTMEAGLSGVESETWFGLLAPARTPAAIVAKLNTHIVSVLREPALHQAVIALGAEPQPSTPEEFKQFIRTEIRSWARIIKATGLSPQ